MTHADHHLPGDPPIPLVLRRSARARRISLRISRLDGRVTLTLPGRLPVREALAFAREKEGWIRTHLAEQVEAVAVTEGIALPLEGVLHEIHPGAGRRVSATGGAITVPGDVDRLPVRLEAYLKTRARDRLAQACDLYAARLGRSYSRITLRDTRSRWGSCSSQGALMFSWRLILAPPEVLQYVAAHEVAHLKEMNHSRAFWAEVEAIFGAYEEPRAWLRENGPLLHRYRF
jgi:predicted metal-dependent hydrolase